MQPFKKQKLAIFENCCIYFYPKGFGSKHLNILQERCQEQKAVLHKELLNTTTHIVVLDKQHVEQSIWEKSLAQQKVVTFQWISNSLSNQSLQDEVYFQITKEEEKEDEEQEYLETQDDWIADFFPPENKIFKEDVVEILKQFLEKKSEINDKWRVFAYRKAKFEIESIDQEYFRYEELKNIKCIGKSIADKIVEYGKNGFCQQIVHQDEYSKTYSTFKKIWGVGHTTIVDWMDRGLKTLEDLKTCNVLLTEQQKIGLKYYQDFQTKIPRNEIEMLSRIIQSKVHPNIKVEIVGSYRRGKELCGDVDILMTDPTQTLDLDLILPNLIKDLGCIIQDNLTKTFTRSYMGVYTLDNFTPRHRIDLKVVDWNQWPFALLGWTGSSYFNRSIRLMAKKKGFHLCSKELTIRGSFSQEERVSLQQKIDDIKTETDIFNFFSLPFKTPEQRNI